jgi:hypothetical protein
MREPQLKRPGIDDGLVSAWGVMVTHLSQSPNKLVSRDQARLGRVA